MHSGQLQTSFDRHSLPPGFISSRDAFYSNLKQRELFLQRLDATAMRWAARLHRLAYLPGLLEDVYGKGYENFPPHTELAPIVGISHKKVHDVLTAIAFMAGRPLDHFHNVTLVAQGGLFGGIFTYRDIVPDALKRPPLLGMLTGLSRMTGRWTGRLMKSFHAHPVFREGVDVPTEADYYDHRFAGPRITGMDYSSFLRHASRMTMNSVVTAQKEMIEKNRSFIIFPEGKYMHDGSIAEMQDLAGIVAFRKERGIIPVSLTYDELCADSLGRCTGWANASAMIDPPREKKDIPEFLQRLSAQLQRASVVTASHLIGFTVQCLREKGQDSVEPAELRRRFDDCVCAALESGSDMDLRLASEGFREERLDRFLRRRGRRWLVKNGGRLHLNEKAMGAFARSERTVDDIAWNANNIKHLRLPR